MTADYLANSVSVLPNRGDGSFQAKLDYATEPALSVAIGDLNGDGKPDLATANGDCGHRLRAPQHAGPLHGAGRQGKTLPAAKRTIARANCRVGKIRRAYSKNVRVARTWFRRSRGGA